ncbi:unnamed protein product [Cylicocyclus nassatus]|uniref:acid phosphatase n=1 Tax=Cylicocyclus nassatus TaxID=53992 RepID=A0AA36H946_CYLNA|nr:unnamed protein product [Cylicocyclus nassatus]
MVIPLLVYHTLLHTGLCLSDAEMDLLFVHVIWRHGDRSPLRTFPSDPIQEDFWKFGGGGFGELSPLGMKQHYNLGKQIRRRYVDTKFLSKRYSAREIYVRSSDFNRTINSAMSNLIGMYGFNHNDSVKGVDYPDVKGWPDGYVPIAVHTIPRGIDYLLASPTCRRRNTLRKIMQESEEARSYITSPPIVELFKNLSVYCDEDVNANNVWSIRDVLMVEQIHASDTLRIKNKWFSDKLFEKITEVDKRIELYKQANFSRPVMFNDLDVWQEYQKVRGGSLLNEIDMRMKMKLDCQKEHLFGLQRCKWINHLKYYAYSGHDANIISFFAIFKLLESKLIMPDGYVPYAAAIFVELWMNRTEGKPYFKLCYHRSPNSPSSTNTIYTITPEIEACAGKVYCKLDVFENISAVVRPNQEMHKWCLVDPNFAVTSWLLQPMTAFIFLWVDWVCF